jgi:hypothetical protein
VTKYSEDEESKARSGDLTFFDKDSTAYPKPVVEGAFKLAEVGDVSPPIKTDKGFVILKLTQKRPGFNRPLAEVKRQIQQRLFRDTRTKALDAFIADLKKNTKIEYHEENLGKIVIESGTDGDPHNMPNVPGMPSPAASAPPPGTPAPRPVPQGKP